MRYKPCFNGYIRMNRIPSFLYNVLDRVDNKKIKISPFFLYNTLDRIHNKKHSPMSLLLI